MYQIYDDILTKEEQETLNDIFFDTYFPYFMAGASVDSNNYNDWSDNNTVESQLMIHTFINDETNEENTN